MAVLAAIGHDVLAGLRGTWNLLLGSLWGLTLGFLLSAVVQTLVPESAIRRYASDSAAGIAVTTVFGVISSSCNYASAAITRSLYRRGAGPRSAFAFLISSTSMNIAMLALAWSFLGWRGALGLFTGGLVIILVVVAGFSLVFRRGELEQLRSAAPGQQPPAGTVVTEDVICGMRGNSKHAVEHQGRSYQFCTAEHARQFCASLDEYTAHIPAPAGAGGAAPAGSGAGAGAATATLPAPGTTATGTAEAHAVEEKDLVCGMQGMPEISHQHQGRTYWFCGSGCRDAFAADPGRYLATATAAQPSSPWRTPYEITRKFAADVNMLRKELVIGYLVAGFAIALVPRGWRVRCCTASRPCPSPGMCCCCRSG